MTTAMDFALFLVDLIVHIILTGLHGALQVFHWAAIYGHFCDALEDLAELHLLAAIDAAAAHLLVLLRALRRTLRQLGRMARALAVLAVLALLAARRVVSHAPIALVAVAALAAKTLWCLFIHIGRCVCELAVCTFDAAAAVRCILATVSTTMTKALTLVGCGSLSIPITDAHGRVIAWRQVNVRIGLNVSVIDVDVDVAFGGSAHARVKSQPVSHSLLLLPPTSAIVSATATATATATDGARGVHVDARAAAVARARVISLELTQTRPVSMLMLSPSWSAASTSVLSAWLLAWHSASLERGAASSSSSSSSTTTFGPQELLTYQDPSIKMPRIEPAGAEITHDDDSETASDTADESESESESASDPDSDSDPASDPASGALSEPAPTAEPARDALETSLSPDHEVASQQVEVDGASELKEDLADSTALSDEDDQAIVAVETTPTTPSPAVRSSAPRRTPSRPPRKPVSHVRAGTTTSASAPLLPRLRVTQVPPSRPAPTPTPTPTPTRTPIAARGKVERRTSSREPLQLHRGSTNAAVPVPQTAHAQRGNTTTRGSHQPRRVSVNVPANYDTNQRARVYDFEQSPKWAQKRADALARVARAARAN